MNKIKKIVIPVAGLGTRVLPASKSIPKEMLTVVDKPIIQHVVEEGIGAGFTDFILVTRSGKSSLEDHFDTNFELESVLKSKNKTSLFNQVANILPSTVSIATVRQERPLGLGHAVLCAAPIIGSEPFAVMLPDVLVHNSTQSNSQDLATMVTEFSKTGAAQIMVNGVPVDKVDQYGIVDCDGKILNPGENQSIIGLVEKPSPDNAPSNHAIVGRYILPASIMEILREVKPGAGGEIQLTDAIDNLITNTPVEAYSMVGDTYDCGNKLGYLQANFIFGLDNAETKNEFAMFVHQHLVKTMRK